MLVVTYNDVGKLHKALTEMDDKALPHAVKNSLNTSAFATKRQWEVEGRQTMTIRTSWAFRNRIPKVKGGGVAHHVIKARLRKRIDEMESVAGNTHTFMEEQERGFVRHAGSRVGVPMPTTKSRIAQAHTRLMRRVFWRTNIDLGPRYDRSHARFGGNPKRYAAGTIRAAKARGLRFVFLDFGDKKGIYDVTGKRKMTKVWDMSKPSRKTKPNPMLRRTLRKLQPHFLTYHRSALEDQIRFVLRKRGVRLR